MWVLSGSALDCSCALLKDAICAAVTICLGAYHFDLECAGTEAPQSVTAAQLITILHSCTSEAHQATEELRYIRDELFKLYCRARWRPLGRPPQPYSCGGPRCCIRAPC